MRRDAAVIAADCEPGGSRSRRAHGPRASGLAFALLTFLVVPAFAAPRSIDDCESITEADAYNLCLASFGPTRAQKAKSYPGKSYPGMATTGGAPKVAAPRIPSLGARAHIRHSGGRVHMEFAPRSR